MKFTPKSWLIIGLLVISTAVAVMAITARETRPPLAFEWDFSVRHEASMVPWPPDNRSNIFWWGRRKLHVMVRIDPDMQYVNDDASDVYVTRKGLHLTKVEIAEKPTTADGASRRAAELLEAWGGDVGGLEDWRGGAVGDSVSSYLQVLHTKDKARSPEVSVQIFRSAGTPDRPWYAMIQLYWVQAASR